MIHHPIHLLHLTKLWLRWVTIQPGATPQVTDSGSLAGKPEDSLEQWAARPRDSRSRIVLYDGRPIYYSFSLTMPTEALRQKDRILRLKLAQEVGLSENAVFWATRTEPRRDTPGQSDVFLVVARREALQDVVDWRERHRLRNLWVGADLCAIRALLAQAEAPWVLVNADPIGATLFHAKGTHQVVKERVDDHAVPRPDLGWNGANGRLHFGGSSPAVLFERFPSLAGLPQLSPSQLQGAGAGAPRLAGVPPQLLEFDPVLLGGILEHAVGHPPLEDLVREITPPAFEVLMRKFTLKRLVVAASLAALIVATLVFLAVRTRAGARERLAAQVGTLEPTLRQLQSQEAILRTIKSARRPTLAVFEAIHKAAPAGVVLKTLSLGESGSIQMVGQAPSPEAPNQFAFELARTTVIDRVALKEVKRDPKGNTVSFQIVCHAKGRGK